MRLLLDTHALLWFYLDDPHLSLAARTAILDPGNDKFVSPAAYWELAIKVSVGKYALSESVEDFLQHAILDNGFVILPIEPAHVARVAVLPFHHKDPFDRLMIAQALVEGCHVVTSDVRFDAYSVTRLW